MPVGVLGRLGLAGLVDGAHAELVLVALLQFRHCALADVALDLCRLRHDITLVIIVIVSH